MRIAFIRVHKDLAKPPGDAWKESSSSKGLIAELERQGIASGSEEWRFSMARQNGASGMLPIRTFHLDATGRAPDFSTVPSPDVLWIEGSNAPPYLRQVFERLPQSMKLVYSKDWKPEKVEAIEGYDLCLVDEGWQAERLAHRGARAAVWDKLIDYEGIHRPLDLQKRYDLCYVAYLRRRKQHELLFRSMADVRERNLTCVCVGGDPDERLPELKTLVDELGIDVTFAGDVPKADVNVYVNESRIGVMCSREDGAPRGILEYMASDVPVLVNAELLAGARYVGAEAGMVCSPGDFASGITTMLDKLDSFRPRAHLLEHFSRERAVETLVRILREAARAAGKRIEFGTIAGIR